MSKFEGQSIGMFETDNLVGAIVAMDQATKTAAVTVQGVERNRLKSGACVKIRGAVADVKAAMDAAIRTAEQYGEVTSSNVIARPTEGTEIAMEMTINK